MTGSKMEKTKKIEDYLDSLYPNPKCELNYRTDYELLIAVMLSAQTTDKRVNEVTKILFDKYPTLAKLKDAKLEAGGQHTAHHGIGHDGMGQLDGLCAGHQLVVSGLILDLLHVLAGRKEQTSSHKANPFKALYA